MPGGEYVRYRGVADAVPHPESALNMNQRIIIFLSGLLALGLAPWASARLSASPLQAARPAATPLHSAYHRVLILHQGQTEQLLFQIQCRYAAATGPRRMVWLVPLPKPPTYVRQIDPALLENLHGWAERLLAPPAQATATVSRAGVPGTFPASIPGAVAGNVPASELAGANRPVTGRVGGQAVEPIIDQHRLLIQVVPAGKLSGWLKDQQLDDATMPIPSSIIENELTFLCVQYQPLVEGATLPTVLRLPAFHVTFDSDRPHYPFQPGPSAATHDIDLLMLTGEAFDYTASTLALRRLNWNDSPLRQNLQISASAMPLALAELVQNSAGAFAGGRAPTQWRLNLLLGRAIPSTSPDSAPTSIMPENLYFQTGSGQPLSGELMMLVLLLMAVTAGLGAVSLRRRRLIHEAGRELNRAARRAAS